MYTLDRNRSECALEPGKLRWWIRDSKGEVIEGFDSRSAARARLKVWNNAAHWQRVAHIPYPFER